MLVNVELTDAPAFIPKVLPPKEMISVRGQGDTTFVRVNSSSIGVIQECQRKAKYLLQEKWHSENESPALVFGQAMHRALEVFYVGNPEQRVLPDLDDFEVMSYGKVLDIEEMSLLHRSARTFIREAKALNTLPVYDKRSIQNGLWLLHNYFKAYLNDPYVAYIDERGPFVERSFTFNLHRSPALVIDYFGTIDFAFRHTGTGSILVGDHKTTSVLSGYGEQASYFDRDRPNSQYCGYLLAAREAFGLDVNEFLVNVIEVKAKPKTNRGSGPSFPRQITSRDSDDYTEFREMVIDTTETYLRNLKRNQWPIGPVNACNQYSGCTYKQVCGAPTRLRSNILKAKFKQPEGIQCPN